MYFAENEELNQSRVKLESELRCAMEARDSYLIRIEERVIKALGDKSSMSGGIGN